MANISDEKASLIKSLYKIEGVKFGDFTLKSGIQSPIYFDLRVIVSFPNLMAKVSELLWHAAQEQGAEYSKVCGVPYTALPLATCISVSHEIPMLIRRKEAKDYGTKKMIEGKYEPGEKCLIIEDVVTSGGSVLETAKSLQDVGLTITDAVVLLNREQGGLEMLKQNGIKLHYVLTVSEVLKVLEQDGSLTKEVVQSVQDFIAGNMCKIDSRTDSSKAGETDKKVKRMRYEEREKQAVHKTACKLWKIMASKQTNLALSADVTKCAKVLELADAIGPYICILKTHVDILEDFSQEFVTKLKTIAQKHNFLIFEDRKFADIGNTVMHQLAHGIYKIADWADIVNAHILPGEGIITGLKSAAKSKDLGCVLIAQMSSKGNFAVGDYTKHNVQLAQEHEDFVFGFISTSAVTDNPKFVHLTPGVNLGSSEDSHGQQYNTPSNVIINKGSDIIIVGRGIYEAKDPVESAKAYRKEGYNAYLKSLE
ncbi:uncharacterized protein LOC135685145 [Rhopilema esculentum]|uniref:uncharacterized protein LOC135685145 n=1 Tax=Rhopilema esculentum TaxID=499914 RepID=UPI0031DCF6A2|eukprot:gene17767-9440_t